MRTIPALVLACLVSGAAAQDSLGAKNAFGWEHGLSYRRYLSTTVWIGGNVNGNYEKSHENGVGRTVTRLNSDNSIALNDSNDITDTSLSYDVTIKIEAGKQLFRFKRLKLDVFGGVGYFYEMDKTWERSPSYYSAKKPNNSILILAGCEPSVMLWNRLSVGLQFGVQFTHTWRDYTYVNQVAGTSSIQTYTSTTTTYDNACTLIGNVSLTDNLIVLFYF